MANTTTPRSANYNGWFYDAVTPAQKYYIRGTLALTISGNDLTCADALTVTGAATLGTATTTGNHTFSSTITAGSDSVGSDGEQLTSGGAAAECDWATA